MVAYVIFAFIIEISRRSRNFRVSVKHFMFYLVSGTGSLWLEEKVSPFPLLCSSVV